MEVIFTNKRKIFIGAHCGDKRNFPQNVMEGFKSALEFGVDMIETDIRMTADGELVLTHDVNLLHSCGVDKNLTEMTLDEVKTLNKAYSYGEKYDHPMRIPTVRELMELVQDYDVIVNWEIKVWPQSWQECMPVADKLIDLIEEYGLAEKSMISCFNNPIMDYIYKKCGKRYLYSVMGIAGCVRDFTPGLAREEYADYACMYANENGGSPIGYKKYFDHAIAHGIVPYVCLPTDTEEDVAELLSYGCRGFLSNNIYEIERILKKLGVR